MYVYIPSGSIYEHPRLKGISHFLEHMLFKNKGESKDLAETLTSVGGKYNAATYKDTTYFYVETNDSEYKNVVDALYQITRLIAFDKDDIIVEKKVILEEMGQHSGGKEKLSSFMNGIILHPKNVYNNTVIGNKHTITGITTEDLKKYARDRYKDFMVMVNCNERKRNEIEKYVCNKFQIKPNDSFVLNEKQIISKCRMFDPKIIFIESQEVSQYMSIMTFAISPNLTIKQFMTIKFIQYALTSSGLHSILNNLIRVKHGLVYSMASLLDPLRYVNLFHIQFSSNNKRTDNIMNMVMGVLTDLKKQGLDKDKFAFYKRSYMNTLRVKVADQSDRTQFYGLRAFYGDILTDDLLHNTVKEITQQDVITAAHAAFDFKNMGVFSIGAYADVDDMSTKLQVMVEEYEAKTHA